MTATRKPDIAQIITPGQIKKIKKIIGAELQTPDREGKYLNSTYAELVIMHQSSCIAYGFHACLYELMYIYTNMNVRRILVDRSRTPQQMIDATGLVKYTDKEVVESMPIGNGEITDVYLFSDWYSGDSLYDEEVDSQYARRGLIACDPFSLAQVIIDDPSLVERHIGTHWKDGKDRWCRIEFDQWRRDECVFVNRTTDKWRYCWLAGIPKDPKTAVLLKTIVKRRDLL
ncbi:MAG: hypothetical protein WCT08_03955 [Patescibacteria group bacterium]|jgi:hypothetical protein